MTTIEMSSLNFDKSVGFDEPTFVNFVTRKA